MIPTIPLETIAKKWRDALANSVAITDFCMTNYGKLHTVYVGVDPRKKPKAEDCPYLVIGGFTKQEGLEQSEYHYNGSVGWVVVEKNEAAVTGNIKELLGQYHVDELGQLIWQEIAAINPNYPLSELNYSVDMLDYVPQYVGHAFITLTVPVVLGTDLSY